MMGTHHIRNKGCQVFLALIAPCVWLEWGVKESRLVRDESLHPDYNALKGGGLRLTPILLLSPFIIFCPYVFKIHYCLFAHVWLLQPITSPPPRATCLIQISKTSCSYCLLCLEELPTSILFGTTAFFNSPLVLWLVHLIHVAVVEMLNCPSTFEQIMLSVFLVIDILVSSNDL